MTDISKHVTSLELSKKLRVLGVPQTAFWSWYETVDRDDTPRLNRTDENCPTCCLRQQKFEAKYSAFLASELGEMLPDCEIKIEKRTYSWLVGYYRINQEKPDELLHLEEETTLPGVMAKMLIYLVTNSIVSLESTK